VRSRAAVLCKSRKRYVNLKLFKVMADTVESLDKLIESTSRAVASMQDVLSNMRALRAAKTASTSSNISSSPSRKQQPQQPFQFSRPSDGSSSISHLTAGGGIPPVPKFGTEYSSGIRAAAAGTGLSTPTRRVSTAATTPSHPFGDALSYMSGNNSHVDDDNGSTDTQ